LATHLVPDAVDVLRPSGDLRPNSRSRELFAKKTDDIVDITLAVRPTLVQHPGDRFVRNRLERAQAQILELPLQLPDAETVGERGEEILPLTRGALAPLRELLASRDQMAQRLRALGELDQDDAN